LHHTGFILPDINRIGDRLGLSPGVGTAGAAALTTTGNRRFPPGFGSVPVIALFGMIGSGNGIRAVCLSPCGGLGTSEIKALNTCGISGRLARTRRTCIFV
jgi:hypothetical protein